MGTRNLLEHKRLQAMADWISQQQKLMLADTTMRSTDMIKVATAYAANLPQQFSVECWGGATFDVADRFV